MNQLFSQSLLLPVCIALLCACWAEPIYIPDSYEQAFGWICRTMEHPSCTDIDIHFRPPTMSLTLGVLSYTMSPFLAVGVLSLLCVCWVIYPIGHIITRYKYPIQCVWIFCTLIMLDTNMRTLLSLADARIFALLPLFSAWALISIQKQNHLTLISAGLLVGASATTRPEILGCMLLFWIVAYIMHNKKAYVLILSSCVPFGTWIALLSYDAGKLVFGPRYWEGGLLAIWEFIPKRLALRLYGMGLYSPEARTIPHNISSVPNLNAAETIEWLYYLISIHPLIWLSGGISIILGLKHNKQITFIGLGIAIPYFLAMILPQARSPLFPQANIIPLLIVLYAGTAILLWGLYEKYPRKYISIPSVFLFVWMHWFNTQTMERPIGIEQSTAGKEAINWLKQQPTQSIMSSYENASLIWLSKHQWQQKSTNWEGRETTWNLYSSIDQDIVPSERPIAFWATEDQWVVISSASTQTRLNPYK